MEIEGLYREIAPKLASYLTGGGLPYDTTCDIVQETFLRLWRMRDELSDDPHQVSGLAYTIARNCRNDLARKDGRMIGLSAAQASGEDFASPEEGRQEEEKDEIASLGRRLKASLGRMPVQLLEAFALSRLGNLSVKDIARGTGLSEANVKVRVHRAREMLQVLFRDADGAVQEVAGPGNLGCAVLKAMMMLAAADGDISREELALYRKLSRECHRCDADVFEGLWEKSVRAMAYIGFLSEMLPPESLVREYVREAAKEFGPSVEDRGEGSPERKGVILTLERMASADGEYSRIERACIAALARRIGQ